MTPHQEAPGSTAIDFRVRPAQGLATGCVMQLSPGKEPASFDDYGGVYMSETAFGFVEPFIGRIWPAYLEYGHFGVTEIPEPAWRQVVGGMRSLANALRTGPAPEVPEWAGFGSDEAARQFRSNPESGRELADMLDELGRWVDHTLRSTDTITVCGI